MVRCLHRQQSRGTLRKLNLGSCVAKGEVGVVRACGVRRPACLGDGLCTRVLQGCSSHGAVWGGRGEGTHQQQTDRSQTSPRSGNVTEPELQCGLSCPEGNRT